MKINFLALALLSSVVSAAMSSYRPTTTTYSRTSSYTYRPTSYSYSYIPTYHVYTPVPSVHVYSPNLAYSYGYSYGYSSGSFSTKSVMIVLFAVVLPLILCILLCSWCAKRNEASHSVHETVTVVEHSQPLNGWARVIYPPGFVPSQPAVCRQGHSMNWINTLPYPPPHT